MLTMDTLSVTVEDRVATILLTRPELQNRVDAALHVDLVQALTQLSTSSEVRAIVLASTGAVFSAGGDFDFMRACHDDLAVAQHHLADGRALIDVLVDMPIPIVSAVQGPAAGLGANVVLATDCVVACRGASISDTHVKMGLVAGDGGCLFWPEAVGMLRARRYLLTGDALKAEEAWRIGLVTDLVDTADEVLPAALKIAGRLAGLPPMAVAGTKRALSAVTRRRAEEVAALAFELELETIGTDDLLEAIAAFKQRRRGDFHGR